MSTSRTTGRRPLPRLGSAGVQTVHANAVSRIRDAILHGELAAGTHLVQTELATSLQVSVTPVREALRELATEGLVDFDAFRGAVVHTPTLAEMDEIYSVRCALIPLAVERSIAHLADDELELALSLCARMESCGESTEWVELNRRFHHVLDAAPHSPHLSGVLARLADISVVYVNLSLGPDAGLARRDDANDEHRRLVEAYVARDASAAGAVAVSHLTRTIETVRRAFLAQEPGASVPRTHHPSSTTTTTHGVVQEQTA